MKLFISISAGTPTEVLSRIATTVKASKPGIKNHATYTSNSCYGQVAHYLHNHRPNNPKWRIMLFGLDDHVTHAVLYDPTVNKMVVDSFAAAGGYLVSAKDGKPIKYHVKRDWDYPILRETSLVEFQRDFM